jgi:hypothetical protein
MTCRGPQIYPVAYMAGTTAPSTANDRYVLITVDDKEVAAVEIDCSSEIDCCIVSYNGGDAFVSVGAPAVGPFPGPLFIKPWRRVMPFGPEVQAYTGDPLLTIPPILAVKVHYNMPPAFQRARATCMRAAPDVVTQAGYVVAAEFPLYGHRDARITLVSAGFTTTYKVEGVSYRARVLASEFKDDPISTASSPTSTQLVLDGTGALERTVGVGATESLTITDEVFDTLLVSVKQGSGAGTARLSYRAEGEK